MGHTATSKRKHAATTAALKRAHTTTASKHTAPTLKRTRTAPTSKRTRPTPTSKRTRTTPASKRTASYLERIAPHFKTKRKNHVKRKSNNFHSLFKGTVKKRVRKTPLLEQIEVWV